MKGNFRHKTGNKTKMACKFAGFLRCFWGAIKSSPTQKPGRQGRLEIRCETQKTQDFSTLPASEGAGQGAVVTKLDLDLSAIAEACLAVRWKSGT